MSSYEYLGRVVLESDALLALVLRAAVREHCLHSGGVVDVAASVEEVWCVNEVWSKEEEHCLHSGGVLDVAASVKEVWCKERRFDVRQGGLM